MSDDRDVWVISAVIEATEADKDAAMEAIAATLCPDEHHPGACPGPWALLACRFEDMEPDERADWAASFADERGPEAGDAGTDVSLG